MKQAIETNTADLANLDCVTSDSRGGSSTRRTQALDSVSPKAFGLTPALANVLQFVDRYIEEHGYSPSYRDIIAETGHVAVSGAHRMVHALSLRGYIHFLPANRRSISISPAGKAWLKRHSKTRAGDSPR
jgi:hypothetical protein